MSYLPCRCPWPWSAPWPERCRSGGRSAWCHGRERISPWVTSLIAVIVGLHGPTRYPANWSFSKSGVASRDARVHSSDRGGVRRLVVLGEQLGHELAAAGDAQLAEDRLHVATDGVCREVELVGDLGRPDTPGNERGDLLLTPGQVVGVQNDRRDLRRPSRFNHDCDLTAGTVRSTQRTGMADQPCPVAGQEPRPCRASIRWQGTRLEHRDREPHWDVDPEVGRRGLIRRHLGEPRSGLVVHRNKPTGGVEDHESRLVGPNPPLLALWARVRSASPSGSDKLPTSRASHS